MSVHEKVLIRLPNATLLPVFLPCNTTTQEDALRTDRKSVYAPPFTTHTHTLNHHNTPQENTHTTYITIKNTND